MDRNPQKSSYRWRYDLLNISILKRLVKLRSFQFLVMWPNLVFFIMLIYAGIFGNPIGNKNIAVMFVWLLWYALLMLFMVPFGSRLWCMICPMPSFGEWLQRGTITGKGQKTFGLNKRPPEWLDSIWVQNFFFITISSLIGVLMTRGWATSIMLITLFGCAFALSLIYGRRFFCRYVCPVSGFIGLYSMVSTLELRTKDRNVCMDHLRDYRSACQDACPAGINAQEYILHIGLGDYRSAVNVVRERMPFVGICGRICTHPCELECERGKVDKPIAIRDLKRFIADYELRIGGEKATPIETTKADRVAIIGSGPAGLSCAYDLIRNGYPVTVFEAAPNAGGLMRYGIPEFRLPREILDYEIDYIRKLGVEIKTDTPIDGKNLTLDALKKQGYRAIVLATGANLSRKIKIEDLELDGVLWGLDFLKDVNLGREIKMGDTIVVVGGGNVAMDVALTALRLNHKRVQIVCLEKPEEMPAFPWEIEEAVDEGVTITNSYGAKRVLGDGGKVTGVELVRCVSVFDKDGRFNPSLDESDTKTIKAETVIFAIGQAADLSMLPPEIKTSRNTIAVDRITFETSVPGIFACGDVQSGPVNVVNAIASGKEVAISVDRYLQGADLKADRPEKYEKVAEVPKEGLLQKERAMMPTLELWKRTESFAEIDLGFDEKTASEEALRCLHCGTWTMDCMRGNENGYGCPWFESPQHVTRDAYCGLCMECVKTCPNDNIALNLRLGGEDLTSEPWHGLKKKGLDEAWKAFIMTTLAFLYGIVFMGPFGWLKDLSNVAGPFPDFARTNFSLPNYGMYVAVVWGSSLLIMPAIFGFFVFLSKIFSGTKEVSYKRMFINYSYALVPLGLMAWMAFSAAIMITNASYIISVISDPFGWGWNLFGTRDLPWTPYLSEWAPYIQTAVLILGLLFSVRTTWNISSKVFSKRKQATKAAIPIIALLLLITVAYLWLWIGGGL